MTDGLERCPTPWCGPEHEKYTWQGPDDLYCVICDGCQVEGPCEETESEAIAAWNTRTTSLAAQDGLVDALTYLESEARRFAGMYPDASDGRNTFLIFADKIASVSAIKGDKS